MIYSFNWTIPSWGIWAAIVLFIIGLVLIIKGGDIFVDAAVWMADVLHMPKFLIGATIVSVATTLPELLVSIFAVAQGDYSIGVGNAVGSVTANTGLILALSAMFLKPSIDRKEFGVKGGIIILVGLTMFFFTFFGHNFSIVPSIILLLFLGFHFYNLIKEAKANAANAKEVVEEGQEEKVSEKPSKKEIIVNIVKFVLGACGIVIGAQLMVNNSTIIAEDLGVSEGIIGITIVAIGTSLPELVTTLTAIRKKQAELGVGNIIGANIIDLCLILPVCSFIARGNLIVEPQSYILDIPAMLIISIVAIIPTLFKKKFSLWQGLLMLVLYVAYIALAAIFFITA